VDVLGPRVVAEEPSQVAHHRPAVLAVDLGEGVGVAATQPRDDAVLGRLAPVAAAADHDGAGEGPDRRGERGGGHATGYEPSPRRG
jgi:hypothetical protein